MSNEDVKIDIEGIFGQIIVSSGDKKVCLILLKDIDIQWDETGKMSVMEQSAGLNDESIEKRVKITISLR